MPDCRFPANENSASVQAGAWAIIYCARTGSFLFGKRSTRVNKGGAWNFFGGRVDAGEQAAEALLRELFEEAGIAVKAEALREVEQISAAVPDAGNGERLLRDLHYYLLQIDSSFVPRLNFEHSDFRWFKYDRLPTKFNRPTALAIKAGLLGKVRNLTLAAH